MAETFSGTSPALDAGWPISPRAEATSAAGRHHGRGHLTLQDPSFLPSSIEGEPEIKDLQLEPILVLQRRWVR